MTTCDARQHSDQMVCGRCGTAWDVNDPEPPQCGKTGADARSSGAPSQSLPKRRRSDYGRDPEAHSGPQRRHDDHGRERGKTAIRVALATLAEKTEAGGHLPANPGSKPKKE